MKERISHTLSDRTLALAGVLQALKLVQQIARTGLVDQSLLEATVKSLYTIDAANAEAVYAGAANLRLGFETLIGQLGGNNQKPGRQFDSELTKYLINVLLLERKLSKTPTMLRQIAAGIEESKLQVVHFTQTHDNVMAKLADIYVKTISTLKPRIMVNGEHHQLANTNNANKIRVLLLAAIRSVVLWRQCGGTRWQLLIQRKQIIATAESLLKQKL